MNETNSGKEARPHLNLSMSSHGKDNLLSPSLSSTSVWRRGGRYAPAWLNRTPLLHGSQFLNAFESGKAGVYFAHLPGAEMAPPLDSDFMRNKV